MSEEDIEYINKLPAFIAERVQGLGFRVLGFGFGVFRVEGSGFRPEGVQGFRA